jgi:hypothetical protein
MHAYVDAIEWVEMPNTRGMSQFADGGLIASKPYNASGNYINKMSDYCKHCHYDVKQKATDSACPFNSLYWDFMIQPLLGLHDPPPRPVRRQSAHWHDLSKLGPAEPGNPGRNAGPGQMVFTAHRRSLTISEAPLH